MNILLAGATGAIGTPLLQILVAHGHRVFAMTRKADRCDGLWNQGAIPVVADVLDKRRVELVVRSTRPEAVIHQLTDLPRGLDPARMSEAVKRNAHLRQVGTAHLAEAARACGVERFVAQSIAWAYKPGGEPHGENAPLDVEATGLRGISVGGVAALEHEVLKTFGASGCVLRYGHIYGTGTGSVVASSDLVSLHVEAAAWAAVLAVEHGARGIYNVAEHSSKVTTTRIERDLGWHETLRL